MSERFDKRAVGEHVTDDLSAYIDNMLEASERHRVRAHIEVCADCKADYIELRATQQLLHAVLLVAPPRAFTLTQEMISPAASFWQRFLVPRNVPRFATGSVLAFTLMLLVLVGNYSASSTQPRVATMSAQAGAKQTMKSTAIGSTPAQAAAPFAAPVSSATPQGQVTTAMEAYRETPTADGLSSGATGAQPQVISPSAEAGISSSLTMSSTMSSPKTYTDGQAITPGEPPQASQPLPQSPVNGSTALLAVEGLLALLGIGMAAAAFVARRGAK